MSESSLAPGPSALSLVVITRNAADGLIDCLASTAFASEAIVVDSGSSDNTVELARNWGARVIEQPWLGFGPQKAFAVASASNEWVLCLDADEKVSPQLAASIQAALVRPRHAAYEMRRCNRFLGRWLRHGEGYPDWNLRLFDRRYARWSSDLVHEHVLADNPPGRLDGDLMHASAESLDAYLSKQNRYTTLQAESMFRRGETPSSLRLVMSPIIRFVRFYLIRGGFLDGVPGLVHIAIGCFNSFCKYSKLRALHEDARHKQ